MSTLEDNPESQPSHPPPTGLEESPTRAEEPPNHAETPEKTPENTPNSLSKHDSGVVLASSSTGSPPVNPVMRCVVRRPGVMACSTMGSACIILILLIAANLFTLALTGGDAVLDDARTERVDALRVAQEAVADAEEAELVLLPQSQQADIFFYVFALESGDNLLTEAGVKDMRAMEALWTGAQQWEDYCLREYPQELYFAELAFDEETKETLQVLANGTKVVVDPTDYPCATPLSVIKYFYPEEPGINGTLASRGTGEFTDDFEGTVELLRTQPTPEALYTFTPEFFETGKAAYMRSILTFGTPSQGYPNRLDDAQREDFVAFTQTRVLDLEQRSTSAVEGADFLYFGTTLIEDVFLLLIVQDGLLAVGSIVISALYLRYHTKSWCLTGMGLLHIFMSFPIGYFLYRFAFQVTHLYSLSFLALWLVLGIGADDILVFVDAYRQSAQELAPSDFANLEVRMSHVFRRAASAMLTTTSTTAASFAVTAMAPLPTVSSFGIFAAALILVNYAFVITWYPAIVVIYHRVFEDKKRCCCCFGGWRKQPDGGSSEIALEGGRDPADDVSTQKDPTKAELWFRDTYGTFVTKKAGACGVLFTSLVVVALLGWQASSLRPSTSGEQFLPEDHPLQRIFSLLDEEWPSSVESDFEPAAPIDIVFGMEGIDRSGTNQYDPEDYGTVVYSDKFNLADPASQLAIVTFCNETEANEEIVPWRGTAQGDGECECFMRNFSTWIQANGEEFPVPSEAAFYDNFSTWLDVAPGAQQTFGTDVGLLGSNADSATYATVRCNSQLPQNGFQTRTQVLPVYEAWEDWMIKQNKALPASLGPDAFAASTKFVTMHTQGVYVDQALQGVLASLAVALAVLLVFTQNIVLSLLAIISIACVVIAVLGLYVILGFELGITESLVTMVLVGVSADFTTHYAHAYDSSKSTDRADRTRHMLFHMGITVLGGAVTSFGAGFFLALTQLQFFAKFGISLMALIAFSILFANIFLTPMLALIGPTGNTGNMRALLRGDVRGFCGRGG